MSLHRLLTLPDGFVSFMTEAFHPCTFNAHVLKCKSAAAGITVSWKFLLPPVSTYRSAVFMVYVLPWPPSVCDVEVEVGGGGVWEYNVTTMYNIHPGLWNIFRALWIISGECKRSRSAVSVLSCYDVQSPIPPPCFERGVLSADGLLKCLGLFHADLIMSKRGD